jgi:hypothetical protein
VRAWLGLALALALAGCGDRNRSDTTATPTEQACTEIGCAPEGVDLDFQRTPTGNVEVVLCVEDRKCVRDESRGAPLQNIGDFLPKRIDRVRVAVIVRKDGREIARVARRFPVRISRPNGPDCPPPCRYVRLRLDVPTRTLEAAA